MREIKFRGFNRKNNVWIYGFYLQNRGAHFVCPDEFAQGKSWDDYEIAPDTRGEFTGLKDENEDEVYEGDVLEWGFRRYVCEFCEGGFTFRDLGDGKLILNALVFHAHIIGNIHDNPELLQTTNKRIKQ